MPSREQRAREQLQKKLTFEAAFRRGLIRDYSRLNAEWSTHYALRQFVPSLAKHEGFFALTINEHVRRVQEAFRGDVVDEIPPPAVLIIDESLNSVRNERSALVAGLLVGVAGRRIETAIRTAKGTIEAPIKRAGVVARIARGFLRRVFRRSADTTAATETQAGAEGTKQTVADVLEGRQPPLSSLPPLSPEEVVLLEKIWWDRQDQLVRPHHVDARGQAVPTDLPFIVMGEQLMHPGDRSLGASASNVINCRCSSLFERR